MEKFTTRVTAETLKSEFSKNTSPIREALANAIDANCKNIYIDLYLETIETGTVKVDVLNLDIADDGDGIPVNKSEFEKAFINYKESSKANNNKYMYGKKGKGRYTYLLLVDNIPENLSIYTKNHNDIYKIYFKINENESVQVVKELFKDKIDSKILDYKYNTIIQFKNISIDNLNKIEDVESTIKNEVITFFADRIASKSVNIYLTNSLLDINNYLEIDVIREKINIESYTFSVEYYVWNKNIKLKQDRQKHILFFDDNKNLAGIIPSGKHKLTFGGKTLDHSILIYSSYFSDYDNFDLGELFQDNIFINLKQMIEIKISETLLKIYNNNINKISDEYIESLSISNKDKITQDVYHSLFFPFISKIGTKPLSKDLKDMIARLINVLATTSPDSFIKNLSVILNLSETDSQRLNYIEQNYGIIKAITEKEKILSQIDFLNNFDEMVNGKNRKEIKERTQLHKVIEKNLWLISSEFEDMKLSDIYSDKRIQTILEKEKTFYFQSNELNQLLQDKNINKIPDIFIPILKDETIYIVELKKPTAPITRQILDEVEDKYLKLFEKIVRKSEAYSKIIAYAISDNKTDNARSRGSIEDDIFIKPLIWNNLIKEARDRLNSKIDTLNNELKQSKWKDLDTFIKNHTN